ncbi:hypothetical protein [Alicyclobacillus sp.]|uniref:hypothetical protein n=1 Tax=Alicyclobacillus sp. TaxID=61169 RepID=UPI0025C3AEA7|nr:hypothetical protein [Alicyclobacillus sp.]MCL6516172.1 hypothetical protein [Alicyclobacillus sp.]
MTLWEVVLTAWFLAVCGTAVFTGMWTAQMAAQRAEHRMEAVQRVEQAAERWLADGGVLGPDGTEDGVEVSPADDGMGVWLDSSVAGEAVRIELPGDARPRA